MVSPVTGPFTRSVSRKGPPNSGGFAPNWYSKNQTWYRQKRPYNLNLGYTMTETQVLFSSETWNNTTSDGGAPAYSGSSDTVAKNKAYSELVANLGDASLWAVNLAEHRQSYLMVAKRAVQITRFARALHRFDFPEAARLLSVGIPRGLRANSKWFANNWLEYHFGWEPLVKDIGAAIETLQNPIPPKRIKGRGSFKSKTYIDTGSFGSKGYRVIDAKCRMQADVRVTNPNLHLASQLGFVNPLAVAWELVPFSFVVDWFVNVGQCLASFTDFAGVSLENPMTTTFQVGNEDARWYTGWVNRYRSVYVQRATTISGPSLHARPWKGVSPVRAATAISLLVQQLR